KDAEPAELLRAVRVVAAGEALLSPSVTRRVVSLVSPHLVEGTTSASGPDALTDREREMLAWVATGRSNQPQSPSRWARPRSSRDGRGRGLRELGRTNTALAGVLWGMVAIAAGRGSHTQLNDTYHRVMIAVLGAGLILLLTRPGRTVLGIRKPGSDPTG